MPAPIDPATREAIEDAIRAGRKRNEIAREHAVSGSTVSKIARTLETIEHIEPAFDRSHVESASRARAADNAARRTELEAEFLAVAAEELGRRDSPVKWGNFGGRDNTYNEVELPEPTFSMRSTLVATAARAAKAAADLAGLSGVDVGERTRSLLEQLADDDGGEAA